MIVLIPKHKINRKKDYIISFTHIWHLIHTYTTSQKFEIILIFSSKLKNYIKFHIFKEINSFFLCLHAIRQ